MTLRVKHYQGSFHKKASVRQGDHLVVDHRRYNRYLFQGDPQYRALSCFPDDPDGFEQMLERELGETH